MTRNHYYVSIDAKLLTRFSPSPNPPHSSFRSPQMTLFPGYGRFNDTDLDNFGVDWVIHYQFKDVETSQAIKEFQTLIHDLEEANLHTQVRYGHGASLLVCVKIPRDHLGNMIYKSRVKDWLFGISHDLPVGDEDTIVEAKSPAEELRSIYHAVTWPKHLGGAGITPKNGKWKNITAAFPIHNQAANAELRRKLSQQMRLTVEDLDIIRAFFGEKVAFYFAFIHCYSLFLVFPAVWGVICWLYLGPYSVTCAIVNCVWSIVFVEYWKIRETDLSLRWNVKGVGALKVNRPQYIWDKEVKGPITGEVTTVFWEGKQLLRQLVVIPFAAVTSLALGTLIMISFTMEVFVSEVYTGPFKGYLEFMPTVLLSFSLPTIASKLTDIATKLTDYENYRTQDQYDLAQTSKVFMMNFITSFLPSILTAFVYVPFGEIIVPYLDVFSVRDIKSPMDLTHKFHVDSSRFQQEVIYLSVTAQVLNFAEEVVLPYVKELLRCKWRDYRLKPAEAGYRRRYSLITDQLLLDPLEESAFLNRIRNEAEADEYNVHEDILEMCVQYGYLVLFGVAWPLVPLGFLANNWLEFRGNFFKLSLKCQRPPPIRTDSLGPELRGLEFLTWLGTLSTAAIIYIYRDGMEKVHLSSLLLVILAAEQAYLGILFAVRTGLEKLGSGTLHREEAKRYVVRKSHLEGFRRSTTGPPPARPQNRVRFKDRVDVYTSSAHLPSTIVGVAESEKLRGEATCCPAHEEVFWSGHQCTTADAGVKLIKALSQGQSNLENKLK